MTDLPQPFTALEWYQISMCIGLTAVSAASEHEKQLARGAMAAMERVHGEGYHSKITEHFPCVAGNEHYSSTRIS